MLEYAVIVVAYRSADDLRTLLGSLPAAAGEHSWHAVIVNNDPDGPLPVALADGGHVTIVEAGANLGYSGGLNRGLAAAPPSRYTVFLNPDLTLMPGALTALAAEIDESVSAAVPLILDADGFTQRSLRREPSIVRSLGEALFGDRWPTRPHWFAEMVRTDRHYHSSRTVDWATGAALLVRADVPSIVGEWDEQRFFLYSEETDYSRRIRENGMTLRFTPAAVVSHRGSGSGVSPQLDALIEVNKLRYFRKWHGPIATAVFASVLLAHNAVRPHRPGARAAVRALLSARARAALPGGPR